MRSLMYRSTGTLAAQAMENATKNVTGGLTYRYADQKLGSATYQNALITTIKYNF